MSTLTPRSRSEVLAVRQSIDGPEHVQVVCELSPGGSSSITAPEVIVVIASLGDDQLGMAFCCTAVSVLAQLTCWDARCPSVCFSARLVFVCNTKCCLDHVFCVWFSCFLICLKFRNICGGFPVRLGPELSSLSLCRQFGDSGVSVLPVAVCTRTVMLGSPVGRAVRQRAWFCTPASPWGGDPLLSPWMFVVFAWC